MQVNWASRLKVVLSAWFLPAILIGSHFNSLSVYFSSDEPMNLYRVWDPPLWKVVLAQLMFWSDFNRPMSAIYYLPLFHFAEFNQTPYAAVRLVLLLVNAAIFYSLAKSLSRSWWIATLATLPVAYHAGLAFLVYSGSFIYDILCGSFYFAALLYYVRLRDRGPLRIPHLAVFLALYICALDSKEMAVTLPVLVLAYELFFKGRHAKFVPVLIAAAITAIYIFGKTGHGTLTDMEAYRPVFTWARFAESNIRYLNSIFYTKLFTIQGVLLLWSVLLYIGLRQMRLPLPDPRWLFLWVWVVVTPLPIAFLPLRGGPMLYVVLPGWAMLAALTCRSLARRISRDIIFKGIPRRAIMLLALAGCLTAYVHETWRRDRLDREIDLSIGGDTRELVNGLRAINIQPAAGSRILFLNDPFPKWWTTFFAASLLWEDPTLEIYLQNQVHLKPEDIGHMDYIVDFVDNHFIVRKPL
jgi:hypothetical protein